MKSAVAAGNAAKQMQPILERGSAAYLGVLQRAAKFDHIEALSASGVSIVTLEDFVANARLCHAYAHRVRTLKVLDEDDELSTLMCPDGRER